MVELQVAETRNQKNYYELALLKIAAVSQYRSEDLRFEGLDGYWRFGDMAGRDTGGQIPPVGTIGWFKLSGGNPKTGPNAKPGSVYLDVDGFQKATDEEKAHYHRTVAPEPSPAQQAAYVETTSGDAQPLVLPEQFDRYGNALRDEQNNPTPAYWMFNDEQRRLGMCFNNLSVMLAAWETIDANNSDDKPDRFHYLNLWNRWFREASRGLPLTPIKDEQVSGAIEDAAELDAQADAHIHDVQTADGEAQQAEGATERVEELPW